ncbi:MAG: protein kinase, partial [Myxococcales bacterium]|nr:protein kinase [Myxococcales bacterium]
MADPQESLRSSEPDPLVGTTLRGLYRIERRIGEGGMGNVYAAEHVHLGKRFAVKVLSPSISSSRASVDRLKAEAVAASRIDHDNIVEVVNFDATEDGLVFIVMELLDGESLAVRVARGALPVVDAIRLILPVVDALAVAHDHGIVHRDLKP